MRRKGNVGSTAIMARHRPAAVVRPRSEFPAAASLVRLGLSATALIAALTFAFAARARLPWLTFARVATRRHKPWMIMPRRGT